MLMPKSLIRHIRAKDLTKNGVGVANRLLIHDGTSSNRFFIQEPASFPITGRTQDHAGVFRKAGFIDERSGVPLVLRLRQLPLKLPEISIRLSAEQRQLALDRKRRIFLQHKKAPDGTVRLCGTIYVPHEEVLIQPVYAADSPLPQTVQAVQSIPDNTSTLFVSFHAKQCLSGHRRTDQGILPSLGQETGRGPGFPVCGARDIKQFYFPIQVALAFAEQQDQLPPRKKRQGSE